MVLYTFACVPYWSFLLQNSVRRNLSLNDRFVKTERSFHSKYPGYYWTVILDVESTTKPLDNEADRNLDHSTGSFWSLYDREGLGYGNDQIPPPPPSYEESLFYNIYAEANTTPEYVHHLQVHFEDENWWENNMQSNFAPWPAPAGYAATDITAFCDTSIPQSEPLISTSPNQSAQSVSNISVQQTANHQQQQQDQQATQLQAVDAMPTGATTFPANASTDNVLVSGKVCLVGCTCTSCANCVKSHSMNNETPKKRDITFGSFHPCM